MPDNNRLKIIELAREKGYTPDGARVPLDFYKKELNLVHLAMTGLGYSYNYQKTGNNQSKSYKYITLSKYGEGRTKDAADIIVHKSPSGEFRYFTRGDDTKFGSGSVLDLIARETGKNLPGVLGVLDEFIAKHGLESTDLSLNVRQSSGERVIERAVREFSGVRPLDNYSYLESRGISRGLANHPLFVGQIFNAKHVTADGTVYDNTVFPIRGNSGVIDYDSSNVGLSGSAGADELAEGFDIKNIGHKSKSEGTYSGFWRSNYDRSRPVDAIIVGEGVLDCISHFSFHRAEFESKNLNVMYMATCGQLQESQISILCNACATGIPVVDSSTKKVVSQHRPGAVGSIFDRDLKGGFYTAKLLNGIDFPDIPKPAMPDAIDLKMMSAFSRRDSIGQAALARADVIASVSDKNNSVTLNFNVPNNLNDKLYSDYTADYVRERFSKLNREYAYKTVDSEPFVVDFKQNDNTKLQFSVQFRNIQDHWEIANNFIIEHKFNKSNRVFIDSPVLKDFNDDLQAVKNIDKEKKEAFDRRVEKTGNPYNQGFSNANDKHSDNELKANVVREDAAANSNRKVTGVKSGVNSFKL